MLAVAAGHPPAGAASVSLEVLGDHPVVQYPEVTSAAFKRDRTPDRTPSGRRPVPKGPVGGTFAEMLTLVVPIRDAPPIERGPVRLEGSTTERIRAFVRAAADSVARAASVAADRVPVTLPERAGPRGSDR
ncbi:hypothetical protein [Kitasatospora purpeofusca]|uniref:hypothetical protein n=1 Tax=Kitasatospora purpeofusca TaxID=67352 RepID=UPI0036D34623